MDPKKNMVLSHRLLHSPFIQSHLQNTASQVHSFHHHQLYTDRLPSKYLPPVQSGDEESREAHTSVLHQ